MTRGRIHFARSCLVIRSRWRPHMGHPEHPNSFSTCTRSPSERNSALLLASLQVLGSGSPFNHIGGHIWNFCVIPPTGMFVRCMQCMKLSGKHFRRALKAFCGACFPFCRKAMGTKNAKENQSCTHEAVPKEACSGQANCEKVIALWAHLCQLDLQVAS